jgi:hypothetical protein
LETIKLHTVLLKEKNMGKWAMYKRNNTSKICKSKEETGKIYSAVLSLQERVKICDSALNNEFEILIRGKTELLIYNHSMKSVFMDDWDGWLIETLINEIE